jgi:hypothetical protein
MNLIVMHVVKTTTLAVQLHLARKAMIKPLPLVPYLILDPEQASSAADHLQ